MEVLFCAENEIDSSGTIQLNKNFIHGLLISIKKVVQVKMGLIQRLRRSAHIHDDIAERFQCYFLSGQILDLPSGDGVNSRKLSAAGYNVRAADLFPEQCSGDGFECDRVDMTKALPYEECSFDGILHSEGIEHIDNQIALLQEFHRILKPGGILIFTTLTISGLDLQVLWEHSKSISPPHHINFMSTEGLERLTKRCGFEHVEITTPGKLDVDIIRNTMDEMEDLSVPRFINYIIKHRGQETSDMLQQFLQHNNLSSHARVIGFKGKQG